MRLAAFEHVRMLNEIHHYLTAAELKPGFLFQGERVPLMNPQRGIYKPQRMRFLLSIKTVYPKPGGKVWYSHSAATKGCWVHSGRDASALKARVVFGVLIKRT
jgi:hypothetical protein